MSRLYDDPSRFAEDAAGERFGSTVLEEDIAMQLRTVPS